MFEFDCASELWGFSKALVLLQRLLLDGLVPLEVLAHFLDPSCVFVLVDLGNKGHAVG